MMKLKYLLLLSFFLSIQIFAQNDPANPADVDERLNNDNSKSIWIAPEKASIYPVPVNIKYDEGYTYVGKLGSDIVINLKTVNSRIFAILSNQLEKTFSDTKFHFSHDYNTNIALAFNIDENLLTDKGDQAYKLKVDKGNGNTKIIAEANSEKGLAYAAVSIVQLFYKENNKIYFRPANVIDWPAFKQRVFSANPLLTHLNDDLDWMLKYKIECLAIHNQDYSWNYTDDTHKQYLKIIGDWNKKYTGLEFLQILNMYKGKNPINVCNDSDFNSLCSVIEEGYNAGVTRVMLTSDDVPPFSFENGYELPTQEEKEKFGNLVNAHVYLIKRIKKWLDHKRYDVDLIYCPAYYTQEEMHYGDMNLFKGTPWEEQVWGYLKRDLKYLGENVPKDVQIIWTGLNVCTRTITDDELQYWRDFLQGRTPYLFDNSIFAQHLFTASTMFAGYQNDFPENFGSKTGGSGIFLNGDATGETSRASSMTANAYMWEGDSYSPTKSIDDALHSLYPADVVSLIKFYKTNELELIKEIRTRKLWFEANSLWDKIRKAKMITQKNPSYNHKIYTRLKALKVQVQNSIVAPGDKNKFYQKCLLLDKKRTELLNTLLEMGYNKLAYSLMSEKMPLPEINAIK